MRYLTLFIVLTLGSFLTMASAGATHPMKQFGDRVFSPAELEARLVQGLSAELPKGIELQVESTHTDAPVPSDASLSEIDPHPPLGVVTFQFRSAKGGRPIFGNAVVRGFARVAISRMPLKHGELLDGSNCRRSSKRPDAYRPPGKKEPQYEAVAPAGRHIHRCVGRSKQPAVAPQTQAASNIARPTQS